MVETKIIITTIVDINTVINSASLLSGRRVFWDESMKVNEVNWSDLEQEVAQTAFQKAYEREVNALITEVRNNANHVSELEDIWRLHNFLSAKRHEIDGKYDYNYSVLVFVFATLIKQGWLHLDELKGLDQQKIAKISSLSRM